MLKKGAFRISQTMSTQRFGQQFVGKVANPQVFCIENDGFCIENAEFCIENAGFCI